MRRTTWRGHEPCRSPQFALLFADRMLRNLRAPIHCFEQLMRAIFLRSSLITMTASASNFSIIEIRYISRPSDLWGHSETEGTMCKRSRALGGVDSRDSLLGANQIQGCFWGGCLGCDGTVGFERRGVGADSAADHRPA